MAFKREIIIYSEALKMTNVTSCPSFVQKLAESQERPSISWIAEPGHDHLFRLTKAALMRQVLLRH